MIGRLKARLTREQARLGLRLLKSSGMYDGFFAGWRWRLFDEAEAAGLHVLPVHYYSPVPNVGRLTLDEETPRYFAAGAATLDAASRDLEALVARYGDAFAAIGARPAYAQGDAIAEFRFGIAPYSTVEAELLYGLIRSRRPGRIVEIGCGHTTLLIAEAIRAEAGYAPRFECIEPYRPAYLADLPAEVTAFRDAPLQSVPLEHFRTLEAGDILFIDSSHIVGYGSDVVYEITALLPELAPGVLVHFHDVFLPYEYPTRWITEGRFFWNEQYMLSAMLQDNSRYDVRYPLHQLARQRTDRMQRLFPLLGTEGQAPQGPGALWLEIASPPPG